jgi:hypothetical protein
VNFLSEMARLEKLILVLDRSRKRLFIAVGVAILLHMPLTPVMPVLRLLHRVTKNKELDNPPPQPTAPRQIEVELKEALHNEELRHEQAQVAPPGHGPSLQVDPPSSVKFNKSTPAAHSEEEKDSAKPKDPKKDKVKNVGLEGLDSKMTAKPGITLGLWFSSMREHPLGKRLAQIATCDAEWRAFVNQGVDMMKDFDGVLVVGPNLTDSSQMTAAVRHRLPNQRVHDVMDTLVQRSGKSGHWLTPDVASAKLGRAQRVLIPKQDDLFFVAPTKGWQALNSVKEPLRVPNAEGRAVSLVVVHPHQLFERLGLTLSQRLSELRLEVFTNPDQSIDIKVELEDISAAAARRDARSVSEQLHDFFADMWVTAAAVRAITGSDDGTATQPGESASVETAPRLGLSPDEKTLTGMVHLTSAQARTTLELISSVTCRKTKKPNTAAKK